MPNDGAGMLSRRHVDPDGKMSVTAHRWIGGHTLPKRCYVLPILDFFFQRGAGDARAAPFNHLDEATTGEAVALSIAMQSTGRWWANRRSLAPV